MSQQNRPRWGHGASAAVGLAVGALAAVGIQHATAPPKPAPPAAPANRSAPPFSGVRTQPWTVTAPGTYVFNPGTTVKISPQDSSRGVNAVTIKASGVVIENLGTIGGYRGFTAQRQKNITLRNCTATAGGIPTQGSKHGGSNLIFIDCQGVSLVGVQSTRVAGEHCLYFAQSSSGHSCTNCLFEDTGPHSNPSYQGVWQINSESGSQATNIRCDGCTFRASQQVDAVGIMGGGTPNVPITFTNCQVTGGRRGVTATNYAAHRPSYVLLKNTPVIGAKVPLLQEGGSWIRKQ